MVQSVIGIFQNREKARQAKANLLQFGFGENLIEICDHVDTESDRLTDGQMTSTISLRAFDPGNCEDSGDENSAAIMAIRIDNPGASRNAFEIMARHGARDVNEFSVPGA